ncbi:MmgE/PrpD family protein [Bosea sp. 117]|uniref:MmgE/PrpD family protein n=1 Tax=Bosea sp. 117 TaxID=1125973 RepID=UPI0004944E12|nr:MmgE/PrpD family protein [Bosea sp. 117]
MPSLSRSLAEFCTQLDFADIPEPVRAKGTDAILDTVGVCVFGSTLPWSRIVIDYARLYGGAATSTIIGTRHRVNAPFAALANGALAHGFEMDNLRQPSAGVHAGSTIVPGLLAVAEEVGASGRDVLTAFIAACEAMARIGDAANNTAEKLGFHSPGLTGTFGSAIAVGRLLRLNPEQMTNALGIAASLCSGLLVFSKAGNGGMVKRLHTGRASEGGVLAARLAGGGFTGPDVILEGKFGFFEAFTREPRMEKLLAGLGEEWETARIAVKCYPFHVTAHTPVQAFEDLRRAHGFEAGEIAAIHVATSEKVLSHHNILEPNDIATAQYSLPFCLATAALRDPRDPQSFLADPHADPAIRALARKVHLTLNSKSLPPGPAWATHMRVVLADGREVETERADFRGAPSNPMSPEELDGKFLSLAGPVLPDARALLARLRDLAGLPDIRALFAHA